MSKWHTTEFCETCAKEFCCTSECKYHLLHQIKKAREEIEDRIDNYPDRNISEYEDCLAILDKLIESEENNG
jgi:hypothetical protein